MYTSRVCVLYNVIVGPSSGMASLRVSLRPLSLVEPAQTLLHVQPIAFVKENERERAVLMLKYQNLENERENLIKNYEMSIGQLRDENEQLMKIREGDKVAVAAELDRLRRENNELSIQLQDQINNYDKDRSLWEGKFEFLERQKEQSKQDLEDAQMKFQQTVD